MPPYQNQQTPPSFKSPSGQSMSPMQGHHKARWTVIFIAILIVIVAAVVLLKGAGMNQNDPMVTSQQKLINSMTANGDTSLDNTKAQAIVDASTAETPSAMKASDNSKLIDAMTVQQ